MTEPQNIDNFLIEVKPVMRRGNLLNCQRNGIASAKTVELDSLLVNNLQGMKMHMDRVLLWHKALLGVLVISNGFLLWRVFS